MISISDEEQNQIEHLEARITAKDKKIKNQAEELDYLTNTVVPDLKKENKELKQLKKELTDALEESTKKYFDQLDINADLNDSVTRKGADLQLAKVRLEEIEKELIKLEEEGVSEEREEPQPKEEPKEDTNLSDKLNKKIKDLEKDLSKKEKDLKENLKELNHLNDDVIPKLKSDLSNSTKELKELKESISNKKDDSKLKIIKLENKIKDLEEDILKRTQNNDRLQNELSNKDKIINKLEEKNRNLKESVKEKSDKGFFGRLRG